MGLDLGLRSSACCILDSDKNCLEERSVATTREALEELFDRFPGARIVLEASTSARWIHTLACERGHEVIVANPRSIPVITASQKKSDRNDARWLAQLGQVSPELLSPVQLRGDRYQEVRTLLFAREQLVKSRNSLINFIRAEARMLGYSLPSCSTASFVSKAAPSIPDPLRPILEPVLETLMTMTDKIGGYDRRIQELSESEFPETQVLRQVHGVGPLIALAFVATIGEPQRFAKSRNVGAYFGLVPRMRQSGKRNPTLSITKQRDHFMRRLLVSAATRILGPHGADSDLRRTGLRIAGNGDKRSKAKARIAVARRLGVLLHRLLVTSEVYEPLRNSEPAAA